MSVSESQPTSLTVTLFGPMQVVADGHSLPRLRSRKSLWLLALLVLRAGGPVEREWMASTLWPDVDQSRAFMNLRVVLSELRRSLGAQGVRLTTPGRHTLALNLVGADVDVHTFDEAILSQKPAALERAVSLYRGPLLEGCTEEWMPQERDIRERNCLKALQTLADFALAAGDPETAVEYFRRAVVLDPWQESAQRGLMQALSQGGDTNAALEAYQIFLRLLRKDDPRSAPAEKTVALYTHLRAKVRRRAETPSLVTHEKAPSPTVIGYLPQPLTDLVGREDEREEVQEWFRRSRLVTLTGPGGIGKTRLALAVAGDVTECADGVWLVALEALTDPEQIAPQIAAVLGLEERAGRTPLEGLTGYLRDRKLWLVLDNCEHLLDACADVVGYLLRECVGLRVLATSREVLGVPGEAVWAVPGLAVPDLTHLPTGRATRVRVLAGFDSVRLFVERAQGVEKTFALSADNATAVAEICARLEGIPLALELAAARVRSLTLPQIVSRLDDRLNLLTGGGRAAPSRQRTLRATLDWSCDLLDEPERLLLWRLSVFTGGWTLEAAEGIGGGESIEAGAVLDLLRTLAEKSLLTFEDSGTEGRFRILEMVRQYAWERLEASGAADEMRARHCDWFAAFAAKAVLEQHGADQASWLRRLEREQGNFRSALTWTKTDAGAETCLRMAADLWWFWHLRGYLSEGRKLLEHVLHQEGTQKPTRLRGRAFSGLGAICYMLADYGAASRHFAESMSIFRVLGDSKSVASSLGNLGNVAVTQGDYGLARERYTESLAITRELGEPRHTAATLSNLGSVALAFGDHAAGWELNMEALAVFREQGDKQGVARTIHNLGEAAYFQDDDGQAQALYDEALTLFQELQEPRGICDALSGLGDIRLRRNDYDGARALYRESLTMRQDTGLTEGVESSLREFAGLLGQEQEPQKAVRLWGAAEALREAVGMQLLPTKRDVLNREVAVVRAALGEEAFITAWASGRALTWEQAAAGALEERPRLPQKYNL